MAATCGAPILAVQLWLPGGGNPLPLGAIRRDSADVIPPNTGVVRGPAHGPSARPTAALESLPRKSPPELRAVVSCRRFRRCQVREWLGLPTSPARPSRENWTC